MRVMHRSVLYALVFLMTSSVGLWSQANLGGLTGHITDVSGAAIPDAAVKLINLDTNIEYSAASSSEGFYLVAALPTGRYRLSVSKPGFATYDQEPVTIATGTVSTLDVKLAIGPVTQQVTVKGGTVQIETTTAETGTVMPRNMILDLPLAIGGTATVGASGRRR
jgi:Carboxypeptidase regulatory-like domain